MRQFITGNFLILCEDPRIEIVLLNSFQRNILITILKRQQINKWAW